MLGLLGAVVASAAGTAAELSSVTSKDDATIIELSGDVAEGDTEAMEALLRTANENGRLVSAVRLDSPGGSLVEAVKFADLIRRAKLPTVVAGGAHCASACFIIFAAGIEKFAGYEAAIGVHGVSDKLGHETAQTEAATISMARIVSAYGVPPRIIGQIVVTPAQSIAWLTPDDLRSMGAIMIGRPRPSPSPPSVDRQIASLDLPPAGDTAGSPHPPRTDQRFAAAYLAASRSDYASAIRLWRRLADEGDGTSQYNLGQMYETGQGVAQDFAVAAEWYRRAAESGIPHARLSLGVAYALGRGVPQDDLQAYKWLSLAVLSYKANEGRRSAERARDLVATRMTSREITEAQHLVREWGQQRGR
ncbi:hypothetical protein AS156_36970 [Bradyrhizobium macuxiense]|uniref:Sel1 repeat family protein n=1 Tax=Bradyrhizobium macuxiense TaxID=1755647 RepID=A0A109JZ89_9BRAD|nr:SEL1-like repeat protein [Bradyrhizobium macuxiense]KWV57805.1 hypothetical protein AS156_36970 [Bradyrhizobium macuxiense]